MSSQPLNLVLLVHVHLTLDFFVSFDTVAMVVSFINTSLKPTPMIIGIFEIHNITSATMANQVKGLLDFFGLLDKVFAYIKDKRSNLSILNFALTSMVSCFALDLTCPFVKSCFEHVTWASQYATYNIKISVGFS